MGIFRGKEGPPLELPEGYGQKRLPGDGNGDETSYTPKDIFEARLEAREAKRNRSIAINPFDHGDVDASGLSDEDFYDRLLPTLK